MRLSGSEYSELLQTLLDAYDSDSFARMLRIEFDKPLSHFASERTPFPEKVEAVITKSEQEDWTRELVLAASRSNPGNSRLAQLAAAWQTRQVDATQAEPTSPPSAGSGGVKPGRPWLLFALVVILVGTGIVIWLWLRPGSITPTGPTPPIAAATTTVAATAAPAAQDTPEPPTPATMPKPEIPPLPDFAPPLTTTVLLIDVPQCETQIEEIQSFLSDTTAAMTPPIDILVMGPADRTTTASADARSTGAANSADLVIWCDVASDNGVELHFEAITQRSTPEVFEPPSISLAFDPLDRSQRAALAMVNYLRRDYAASESLLRSVVAMSPGSTSMLMLLVGNSLVFQRRYAAATTTYNAVVAAAPDWAQAWNNLGVAGMNDAWTTHEFDMAEAAFRKAIELDPDDALPFIGLGRIYRWTYDEVPGNLEKAYAACEDGAHSDDPTVRMQGILCTNLTTMLAGWIAKPDAKLPRVETRKTIEDAASTYWAEPLALLGIMESAYWMVNNDQLARQQAVEHLTRYLGDTYDDVHLEESRQLFIDVVDGLALLKQNDAER